MRLRKPILPEADATRMNMVMIVDEIEEEEDGGRRGRGKRTKLMKESKQQIRKDTRKEEGKIRR